MVKIVKTNLKNGRVILKGEIRSICPESKQTDVYNLTVKFIPAGKTIEYFSFKEALKSYELKEIYHEDLYQEIYDMFVNEVKPRELMISLDDNSPRLNIEIESFS
jgi:NADPH-dependent 7-cyano-7-deazaguanine reductase QueF